MSSPFASLESQLESLTSVIATETNVPRLQQDTLSITLVNASLALLSAEQVLSTATGDTSFSASQAISSASSVLSYVAEQYGPYGMIPNQKANLAMTAIMAKLLISYTVLGLFYQTWWFGITSILGVVLELIGHLARYRSVNNFLDQGLFNIQISTLTIAPVFILVGVHYLFFQLQHIFNPRLALMRPREYVRTFIGCDALSGLVLVLGAGIVSSSTTHTYQEFGTHVIIGGLVIQSIGMSAFIFLFCHYFIKLGYISKAYKEREIRGEFSPQYAHIRERRLFAYFPLAIFMVVVLIYIRSFYRVIELAQGLRGYLITHETYFIVFEGALMTYACSMLSSAFHPGFMMGRGNPLKENTVEYLEMSATSGSEMDIVSVEEEAESEPGSPYPYKDHIL